VVALNAPELDIDLFRDEVLTDPYPVYARMRAKAPVVWLPANDFYAVVSYAEARAALLDHDALVSGRGVGFNDDFNRVRSGSIIASDAPRHDVLRSVLSERLGPRALRDVEKMIKARAESLVADAVERGSFDAIKDFAEVFPVEVVGELIGVPADKRHQLLRWANGGFNAFGPAGNERTSAGLAAIGEQFNYIRTIATRDQMIPGSMGAAVYDAADAGTISADDCLPLLSAYLTAGMDTTVNAIGAMVQLLAHNPEQWSELQDHPELSPSVVNEVLRIEAPAQFFGRVAARDVEIGGYLIPEGARLAIVYASANRDERQYPDPDSFDIRRNPAGHLTFGAGIHACAGQYLAKLELRAMLDEMIKQVGEITVGEPVRKINNVLRGLSQLPAAFQQARTE